MGPKRKRGEPPASNEAHRLAPHNPEHTALAQQSRGYDRLRQHNGSNDNRSRRGGGRRGSRSRGDDMNGRPQPIRNNTGSQQQQHANDAPSPSLIKDGTPPDAEQLVRNVDTPVLSPRNEKSLSAQPVSQPAPVYAALPDRPPQFLLVDPSFQYSLVTDDLVSTWEDEGRERITALGGGYLQAHDARQLGLLYQELLMSALTERVSLESTGQLLAELLTPVDDGAQPLNPVDLLLDNVSIIAEFREADPLALRVILLTSNIDPALMRQNLDNKLLIGMGLVRTTFPKAMVRASTNMLYRQSKYNLLREEIEGYSKLMTELYNTGNEEPPSSEAAKACFERLKSLIGAFNLDVGRALDVTLDVFAAVLVKQNRFFVKLLRCSSWWPKKRTYPGYKILHQGFDSLPKYALPDYPEWNVTDDDKLELADLKQRRDTLFWDRAREVGIQAFFEIGRARILVRPKDSSAALSDSAVSFDTEWLGSSDVLPAEGGRVAAQLLGFKLRYYASAGRGVHDNLPMNLIYLAALLIKIGFISLHDLYPHLWPSDDDMEQVREAKTKEKEELDRAKRSANSAKNALAMAGALPDDTPSDSRGRNVDTKGQAADTVQANIASEKKDTLPEPSDQKVQLLRSLLCIGALPEALLILSRFPWIADLYSDVPTLLNRILHRCFSKLYADIRPKVGDGDALAVKQIPTQEQNSLKPGQINVVDAPTLKTLRWAHMDKDDIADGKAYKFYWDDWDDNIPVCQTTDDVFTLCKTLLNFVGVKIGLDAPLLVKITRIGLASLEEDPSESNLRRWADLSKRLIVPALSLTQSNPAAVFEVYDLLLKFDIRERFSIYAEWFKGPTSRLPDIKDAFDTTRAQTRDKLKKISKTNIRPMARSLAKIAYSSPGVVFDVALSQIEAYDNLIDVVVECAQYFTPLAYDVLSWSLINALGSTGRSRVQADGMLTSRWLNALSTFSGQVYARYRSMHAKPILQYVTSQLVEGNSVDLVVLKEIITSMAGIVSDTNFTDAQVHALSGGPLLRQQTLIQLQDLRHVKNVPSRRLISILSEDRLAACLLIAIAQEWQTCIYRVPEEDAQLKILGNLGDEIHRVLAQFIDLLRSSLSLEAFDAVIPSIPDLVQRFGIIHSLAFWIGRDSIRADLTKRRKERREALKAIKADTAPPTTNGDVAMAEADTETEATAVKSEAGETVDDTPKAEDSVDPVEPAPELEMADAIKDETTPDPTPPAEIRQTELEELMSSIRPTMPEATWSEIGLNFYVTFWHLSLHDILVSTKSYEVENARLTRKVLELKSNRPLRGPVPDASKAAEKEALDLKDALNAEMKAQVLEFQETLAWLRREKDNWFTDFWGKSDPLAEAILAYCIVPRMTLSAEDSLYCFRFLKLLHSFGTPNFRTLKIIDHMFREKRLASTIFECTAREAENLGRFLNEWLRDLHTWHQSKDKYETEAFGPKRDLPGFATKALTAGDAPSLLEYEQFRIILNKWHKNLNLALKSCLRSGEYMQIRNAIIVLKAINEYFPKVDWIGRDQLAVVTELSATDKRDDIKLSANALLGLLKRKESTWITAYAFNPNDPNPPPPSTAVSATAASATPVLANGDGGRTAAASSTTPSAPSEDTIQAQKIAPPLRTEPPVGPAAGRQAEPPRGAPSGPNRQMQNPLPSRHEPPRRDGDRRGNDRPSEQNQSREQGNDRRLDRPADLPRNRFGRVSSPNRTEFPDQQRGARLDQTNGHLQPPSGPGRDQRHPQRRSMSPPRQRDGQPMPLDRQPLKADSLASRVDMAPPSGPRGDRPGPGTNTRPEQGRPNRQSAEFGRLNSDQPTDRPMASNERYQSPRDAPGGPRGTGRDGRFPTPAGPREQPDRLSRNGPPISPIQADPANVTAGSSSSHNRNVSGPPTPNAEGPQPDLLGVHPDRLRGLMRNEGPPVRANPVPERQRAEDDNSRLTAERPRLAEIGGDQLVNVHPERRSKQFSELTSILQGDDRRGRRERMDGSRQGAPGEEPGAGGRTRGDSRRDGRRSQGRSRSRSPRRSERERHDERSAGRSLNELPQPRDGLREPPRERRDQDRNKPRLEPGRLELHDLPPRPDAMPRLAGSDENRRELQRDDRRDLRRDDRRNEPRDNGDNQRRRDGRSGKRRSAGTNDSGNSGKMDADGPSDRGREGHRSSRRSGN